MAEYRCASCSYNFSSKEAGIKKCPYCGKVGTIKKEDTTENILEEVDKLIKEGKV